MPTRDQSPSASDHLKLGDLAEELVAGFDLGGVHGFEALEAEGFDIVTSEHAAIDDGLFQQFECYLPGSSVRRQKASQSTGKAIASARRIMDVLERIRGAAEKLGLGTEEQATMLAFFDSHITRAHRANGLAGFNETRFASKLPGFSIVEDEHVHAGDEFGERLFGDVDPEIHRIRDHKSRLGDLVQNMVLEIGSDVRQKNKGGIVVFLRQCGREMLEDIERDGQRLAGIHVPHVFAGPTEGLTGNDLKTLQIDAAIAKEVDVLFREILTHDADQIHRTEIRSGNRTVGSGATQQVFVLSELRFDVIQPNGTNDKNGHRRETMRFAGQAFQQKMPAAALLKLEVLDKRLLDKMTEYGS